ncbi:MAG: GAF domain-containing protein [Chloroflexi bacterium]|nr:GAF domain-containing protein [Chloroflexota bacterium]
MCTPFLKQDKVIGAATIIKPGENQFKEDDLEILNIIANQTTDIFEKARILDESHRQLRVSDLLNEASRSINSSLDLSVVMQSMLTQMNEFLNAEAISIALVDRQTNELVYQVAAGIGSDDIVGLRLPSNQGISGWVMEHNQPALVQDANQDQRLARTGDERTGHHTKAMICAPIHYKNRVLGTIQAINPTGGIFTKQELELLVNLANIASSAIANAQQYARTLKRKPAIPVYSKTVSTPSSSRRCRVKFWKRTGGHLPFWVMRKPICLTKILLNCTRRR